MSLSIDQIAEDLAEFDVKKKSKSASPRDDRIVAGFEEINRFVSEHQREPQNIEGRDIFERLYAVRLEQIRRIEGVSELLGEIDTHSLLDPSCMQPDAASEKVDDEALLAELEADFGDDDLTDLKHVRSSAEKRAAEEIANRTPCQDFDQFEPLFKTVSGEIKSGRRPVAPFGKDGRIEQGDLFILDGLTAYVADVGDEFRNEGQDKRDARLRVVFSNKTESNLLRTSLQRALYKDEASRRVARDLEGTLFGSLPGEGDTETGTIYVLRSQSGEPFITEHRDLIHKIGVTGGSIASRVANAQYEATYLLAGVEVVREYKLVGINRKALEKLLHKFLESARLDIQIEDRFGKPVSPREWFLVPLQIIDEIVELLRQGELHNHYYDRASASLATLENQ